MGHLLKYLRPLPLTRLACVACIWFAGIFDQFHNFHIYENKYIHIHQEYPLPSYYSIKIFQAGGAIGFKCEHIHQKSPPPSNSSIKLFFQKLLATLVPFFIIFRSAGRGLKANTPITCLKCLHMGYLLSPHLSMKRPLPLTRRACVTCIRLAGIFDQFHWQGGGIQMYKHTSRIPPSLNLFSQNISGRGGDGIQMCTHS